MISTQVVSGTCQFAHSTQELLREVPTSEGYDWRDAKAGLAAVRGLADVGESYQAWPPPPPDG